MTDYLDTDYSTKQRDGIVYFHKILIISTDFIVLEIHMMYGLDQYLAEFFRAKCHRMR